MARTVNPEQQKKTKNALFQVAARAFLRDGYAVTGMKVLAAEAGCTTGKFYCYYSGKEEILTDLMTALFRGNKDAAERLAARRKDTFYGAAAFLALLYQGAESYPNLREIYREGLSEPSGRNVAEQILFEMLGKAAGDASEAVGAQKGEEPPAGEYEELHLRIRAALRAVPAFFEKEGEDGNAGSQRLFLTMLTKILGKSPEEADTYAERIAGDSALIRERAYDVLVKLLQGPKRKSVKKM